MDATGYDSMPNPLRGVWQRLRAEGRCERLPRQPQCIDKGYCVFDCSCGVGEECIAPRTELFTADWANATCVPRTVETANGAAGWPCETDSECDSGVCASYCDGYSGTWCVARKVRTEP